MLTTTPERSPSPPPSPVSQVSTPADSTNTSLTIPQSPSPSSIESVTESTPDASPKRKGRQELDLSLPIGSLPPRKRAKTEEEKKQRAQERIMRNRQAAHASREKKRKHVEELERRCKELSEENGLLKTQVGHTQKSLGQMNEQRRWLEAQVDQYNRAIQAARLSGDISKLDNIVQVANSAAQQQMKSEIVPSILASSISSATSSNTTGDGNMQSSSGEVDMMTLSPPILASSTSTSSSPPMLTSSPALSISSGFASPESLVLNCFNSEPSSPLFYQHESPLLKMKSDPAAAFTTSSGDNTASVSTRSRHPAAMLVDQGLQRRVEALASPCFWTKLQMVRLILSMVHTLLAHCCKVSRRRSVATLHSSMVKSKSMIQKTSLMSH